MGGGWWINVTNPDTIYAPQYAYALMKSENRKSSGALRTTRGTNVVVSIRIPDRTPFHIFVSNYTFVLSEQEFFSREGKYSQPPKNTPREEK